MVSASISGVQYHAGGRWPFFGYDDAGIAVANVAPGADKQGAGSDGVEFEMERSDVKVTAGDGNWKRIGVLLHRVSYGKIAFYLLGFVYQVKAMFFSTSSRSLFVNNLVFSLMLYGFAMAFEGLRDNQDVTKDERERILKNIKLFRAVILCGITGFIFAVGLGLFLLFWGKDQFQGVAIISFGFGGLTLMRMTYDRHVFVHASQEARETLELSRGQRSLESNPASHVSVPVAAAGEDLPELSVPPRDAGSRGSPPQAG